MSRRNLAVANLDSVTDVNDKLAALDEITQNLSDTGTADLAMMISGLLSVALGGTGANLSLTGGTNQVVQQASQGAAFTIGQLAASMLSNGVTGSGLIVLATGPTIAGGAHTALTALGIRSTGTGAFDLTIANSENLTAGHTLTITVNNADRTLTISGNATVSGTNTGDQTITLTGDVTGSGAGSFAATIANNAVSDAKIRDGGALSVIGRSANSSGDPTDISASAASGAVLRESGSVLGFGTVATAGIAANAVTDAVLRQGGALSVIGRSANSTGNVADIATSADGDVLRRSGTALGFGTIAASAVGSGQLALARGGTNADLSATGGASKYLKQASSGAAITVVQPASTDLSDVTTWTAVSYTAGDYTGSGSMTWTVDSGDVTNFMYAIVGKMMWIKFILGTTTVGGTPSNILQIKIPASKTANTRSVTPFMYNDNGGGNTIGYADVAASATVIQLVKTSLANWAAATNNTSVYGQIVIEIQ